MKKLFKYAFLIMMLVSLVPMTNLVCATNMDMVSIGSDDGMTISINTGQELQVSLVTNPSTGYAWEFVTVPNPAILKQITHYLKPLGTLPGSPSLEYWVFDCVGPGSTIVNLKYQRSWEPNPLKTFTVNIVAMP